MFGWDFQNRSDRIKLFLFTMAVFLIVGFSVSAFFRSQVEKEAASDRAQAKTTENVAKLAEQNAAEPASPATKEVNSYDQTNHFSQKALDETKKMAVQFVTAYHTYQVDQPTKYLEDAKPYMTDKFYQEMKQKGRREVLERSYMTVKKTYVTPVSNDSKSTVRWNVIVTGVARSIDGKTSESEDWYLVGLCQDGAEWKVDEMYVNVPD